MAPIFQQHQMSDVHHAAWEDGRQARPGAHYPHHSQQHQHHPHLQHQHWPAQGPLHINPAMVRDEGFSASPIQQHGGGGVVSSSRHHQQHNSPAIGREVLGEGSFMGRGYSIKRCQGFVRCDMDIDAEVVGWVIGKNGSTIKDMKHKTGCNMWVDQRALKLTITGPDLSSVEHAAKSVDAYVAAAPIKAGAVEAAVTKTLECPPQLLDDLGDRTTIARIVKETHAQVVVNKKIGRIIVRGDPRSVELAYASVQTMIHHAMHGGFGLGLGLRVDAPDSHASYGPGGVGRYFPESALGSSSRAGGGGGEGRGHSPLDVGAATAGGPPGLHHVMPLSSGGGSVGGGSHMGGADYLDSHLRRQQDVVETPDFPHRGPWQEEQRMLELKQEMPHQQRQLQRHAQHQHQHGHHQHHMQHHGVRGGSDTDESEIETVSLGSIGARTPVSSHAGSPRVTGSYNTSPALSGTASTPVGDWSLFSGGFGLGMAALEEGETASSNDTTPTTARTTPRVHFPQGLRALGGKASDTPGGAVLQGSGLLSPGSSKNDGGESSNNAPAGRKPAGSMAPPPSPASTAGGEASRKALRLAVPEANALNALEAEDSDEEEDEGDAGGKVSERVANLGKLLQAMGLGKYCHIFAENEVDLEALGLMSEGDLADIGIPKGPRLKILNAVGSRAAPSSPAVATASHAPAV